MLDIAQTLQYLKEIFSTFLFLPLHVCSGGISERPGRRKVASEEGVVLWYFRYIHEKYNLYNLTVKTLEITF